MDYKFETRCIHRENEHEEGHPYGSAHQSTRQQLFIIRVLDRQRALIIQERATQPEQS